MREKRRDERKRRVYGMNHKLVDSFCGFVFERQRIWHRRHVLKLPAPWTDDPILQRYHFTNNYRELDRGTVYLCDVLREHVMNERYEKIYNILFYRALNNEETWRDVTGGWLANRDEAVVAAKRIKIAFEEGRAPFTKAWQVNRDYRESFFAGVETWNPHRIDEATRVDGTLTPVIEVLKSRGGRDYPALGKFAGYQAALDLTYVYPNLRCDDADVRVTFTANGDYKTRPDAWRGSGAALAQIFNLPLTYETTKTTQDTWRKLLREVRNVIPEVRPSWRDVAWQDQPVPALYNVEHSLCEWSKHERLRTGVTRGRRLFRPRSQV